MKKYQIILISCIIGVLILPTVTLSGSLVVSLIQGKSPEEAVQILAEQLDFLIGRVEIVETKQTELKTTQAELQVEQTSQSQAVADLQAIISQQATVINQQQETLNQQQVEQEKQKACQRANELFKQSEVVYTQTPPYRIITATTVNDFITTIESQIDSYQTQIDTLPSKIQECLVQKLVRKMDCEAPQVLLDAIPTYLSIYQDQLLRLQAINSDFLVQYNLCNKE